MKFSVLMPVYFKEKPEFFDLALKSNLIEQTVKPNEFVLVCDGPLNNGLEQIIEKYECMFSDILKVYRLSKNVGLGKALNYGLEKCSYDIVARADSDDICLNNRYEKQISFLLAHPDIAVVGSAIDEFDCNPNNPIQTKIMPSNSKEIYKFAKFRNPINHMSVMFRKNVVQNAGSYIDMKYIEDYYLWLRILIAGHKIANISDVLVHARVGNGMIQRRSNKEHISGWRKLSRYMLDNKMITKPEYLRNILSILAFVYMPVSLKQFFYRKILRNKY